MVTVETTGAWPPFKEAILLISSIRRHTRSLCDWSSDVCSSDLEIKSYPKSFSMSIKLVNIRPRKTLWIAFYFTRGPRASICGRKPTFLKDIEGARSHSRRTSSRLSVLIPQAALAALPSIIGAPRIGKGAQGLEKDDQVGLLPRAEVRWFRGGPVLRVQIDGIESGVVAHDLGEGIDAAVGTIACGEYQVAQGRHLELAEMRLCFFQGCLARARGAGTRLVVVVGAEQVEPAFHQLADSALASGIGFSARSKPRQTGVVELAVGEIGSGMAGGAAAFSDENLEPSLRRFGIVSERGPFHPRERVAKPVEGRASAHQGLLEGGQRLSNPDEHRFVVGRRRRGSERLPVAAGGARRPFPPPGAPGAPRG